MTRRRLLTSLLVALLAGFLLFLITPEKQLIEILNTISLSFSVAVVVAYASVGWQSLQKTEIDPDDILVVGILLIHSSVALTRIISLSFRTFGINWLAHTDVVSFSIYLSIMASVCQLNTAVVSKGRVPTLQWVKMGVLAGLSVGALAIILQVLSLWN